LKHEEFLTRTQKIRRENKKDSGYMKNLMIHDSYFVNTEQIALTIGKGFEGGGDIQVKQPGDVVEGDFNGLDFLFVGHPFRKFMSPKTLKMFI
jgi:hypothetical protein